MIATRHRPKHILTGELTGDRHDQGFVVAEIDTERDSFSITGSIYPSKAAYDLGNEDAVFACGQITDEIRKAIPELRPWMHMHLRNTETGEPTLHGLSNLRHALDPNGEYEYQLRSPFRQNREADEIAKDILYAQAKKMGCAIDDLPDRIDGDHVEQWYDAQRERWVQEAADFQTFLGTLPEPTLPTPDEPSDEFAHTFRSGLTVDARLSEKEVGESALMGGEYVYEYTVLVTAPGVPDYEATATGSVADFWEGHTDAKGAAFGVLRELASAGEDPDEFWEMVSEGGGMDRERARSIEAVCAAGERFYDLIEQHRDLIGY